MLVSSVLSEARKHPHLNQKVSINSVIRREYEKADDLPIGIKNSFVSFTKIEKLGINPKSKYKTPIGIYSYPSDYVLSTTTKKGKELSMSSLPFAGKSPYSNIFSCSGNIIRIDNMSDGQYDSILVQLLNVIKTKYGDIDNVIERYHEVVADSSIYAKFDGLVGGRLWYITMTLAEYIGWSRKVKTAIMWNKLFRDLGIDGVVDMGSGIIHTAEETQAVFFKMENITNIKRIPNKYSPEYIESNVGYGEDRKKLIASLKTMNTKQKIEAVCYENFLINYVEKDVREKCLYSYQSILYVVKNITIDDVLAALDGSELAFLRSLYSNTNNDKPLENQSEADDYRENLKLYHTIKKIKSIVQTIPEIDIMHLINKHVTDEESQGVLFTALMLYFPKYDRMFNLLWKKKPSVVFRIRESLPTHFSELLYAKLIELGETDPNNELYLRFKRE